MEKQLYEEGGGECWVSFAAPMTYVFYSNTGFSGGIRFKISCHLRRSLAARLASANEHTGFSVYSLFLNSLTISLVQGKIQGGSGRFRPRNAKKEPSKIKESP